MPLDAGSRLGPYSISGMLGAGGMGEVYRAHDSRLNRDVAIKVLPPSVAADATRLARFQREAQVLASLSHPHIAAIYGLEESAGGIALVMELVEGPTLSERIAHGPIPLEEALALARQIGEALEAAHEKGIVHRDLKPANIKLTANGEVKVLDFGLAKAFDRETTSGASTANSPTLTLESTTVGTIMGTAGYMSPEQARGKPVDKRADIWAFGVVLLEMLTGKSIFEGETVSDTLAAVLRADVDWRRLPADTPVAVRRMLQHCLERDPKRRLRDIGDAWLEIDAPVDQQATVPVVMAAPEKGNRWLPWGVGGVLAAAGIAFGLLHQRAVPPGKPIHWSYSEQDIFALPEISHDGTQLVITEAVGNAVSLSARRLDENNAQPIPGGADLFFATYSPDGQWIAAYSGVNSTSYALKKIPRSGGAAVTLTTVTAPFGITWGDDDTLVYSDVDGLMQMASNGGTGHSLLKPDKAKGQSEFFTPHLLPGSHSLVYTIVTGSSNQVAVLNLKTLHSKVVVENAKDGRYVSAGYLLYTRGDSLVAAPFDARTLAVTGPEAPVIQGMGYNGPNGMVAEYAVSDEGLLVYMGGSNSSGNPTRLGWLDLKGQTQPVSDSEMWGTGRLSPDGRRVVNEIYKEASGDTRPGDIWVFELERQTKTRLTFDGINGYPIWTPDGRRITFYSTNGDKPGIYSVMADGSSRPQLLLATEMQAVPDSWAPDGKTLFYHQRIGRLQTAIWAVPVSGDQAGKPALVREAVSNQSDAQISPDGHWLAYISAETGQNEAYVEAYPGPGGKERVSIDGADSVRWSRDGRQLFYVNRNGEGALSSVDIQTKPEFHIARPQRLAKVTFGTTWDPAPDGKRLLVELVRSSTQGYSVLYGVSDWFEELRRLVPIKR